MQAGYVSIDTLLGFAGFALQIVFFLLAAGVAWGKLQNLSASVTKAIDDLSKRTKTLEEEGKARSKDLARFATIEARLESMGADLHRIATALDHRGGAPNLAPSYSASPDIMAGLRVLASLAGKEISAH
jgi:hypothetical protein